MRNIFKAVAAGVAVLLLATQAWAAAYSFDLTYDGTSATVNAGSQDPVGTNLAAGDSFNYALGAAGTDYWQVNTSRSYFPFLAFTTHDSGTRTANFDLRLLLDGVLQFSLSELGISNSYAHIGTNSVSLGAGLRFDAVELDYQLLGSDSVDNRIVNIAWPGGEPFGYFGSDIAYVAGSAPEPGMLALWAIALIAAGLARRARNA